MRGDVCLNLNLKRVQQQLINAGAGKWMAFFFKSNKLRDK